MFGHEGVGEPPTQVVPPNSELIGPLTLRENGSVWLATFEVPMSAGEVEYVHTERQKIRITIDGDTSAFARSAMAVLVQDTDVLDTMLVALELGRANFHSHGG